MTPTDHAPEPWLEGLNPQQLAAATTLDGPLLVLAGAGTGKTRTLTARLASILASRRAWPSQILAVTFTNKAAAEMRARLSAMVGDTAQELPWLGTFHSIAARMLRRHASLVGLENNFTILDQDDSLRLMKRLIRADGIDEKHWPAKQLAALVDRWKNRGEHPEDVPAGESFSYAEGKGKSLYQTYQQELRRLNAADFGDLLLHMLTIFEHHPDVLSTWQQRFRYALVDEYQDTNAAQYRWLRLLTANELGGHGNVCCVGDDDQSIYSWRGADVGNILRFEQDYPGARIIRLEENYRSTSHILGAASTLVARNSARLGKTLRTGAEGGERLQLISCTDGAAEAKKVAARISRLLLDGARASEIAILVRASHQTREFEECFLAENLPYRIIGGFRFYERAEIRDMLAYLRIVAQPADSLAFERILNTPKRGLGAKTSGALLSAAGRGGTPLLAAARAFIAGNELRAAAHRSLSDLVEQIDAWRLAAEEVVPAELAKRIAEESGYLAMLTADTSPEAAGRRENLQELFEAMLAFDSLPAFLDHVALVMENAGAPDASRVVMMTLHAAKGLEFDHIFLPGWEEGLFPSQRSLDEGGEAALQEERRLAYVGITRARKSVLISHAANRRIYGQWMAAIPSRFLAELPEKHVERHGIAAGTVTPWKTAFHQPSPGRERWRAQAGDSAFYREPGHGKPSRKPKDKRAGHAPRPEIVVGSRVFHIKFGTGTVQEKDGNKLRVAFDHAGEKMLVDSFVEPA